MVEFEVARDTTPALGQVVGERSLEVLRIQEERPTLVASRLWIITRFGQRKGHPGIAQEFAHRASVEGHAIRRNQQAVADLGDAEHVIGQRLTAVKERPTRRRDLGAVTIRRRVHTELWRAVVKTVSRPIAKAAFHRLKHTPVGRATLRPVVAGDGSRRTQRFGAVVAVVRGQPGRRQSDLEVADRPVNQRPDRRVETRAVSVGLRRRAGMTPDVPVQSAMCEFDLDLGNHRTRRRILGVRGARIADARRQHQKSRGDCDSGSDSSSTHHDARVHFEFLLKSERRESSPRTATRITVIRTLREDFFVTNEEGTLGRVSDRRAIA